MTTESDRFALGMDFNRILAILSKEIYDTPFAFLRENVQNAIDAVRIQARRDNCESSHPRYVIDVKIFGNLCVVADNGIGMSSDEQRRLFWTMGESGKRTPEAKAAGCIGSFGIGGLANLGVCSSLRVASRSQHSTHATWTEFTRGDLDRLEPGEVPQVRTGVDASPEFGRGTVLTARLKDVPDLGKLIDYMKEVARYAPEHILVNGELISRQRFTWGVVPGTTTMAVAEPDSVERERLVQAGFSRTSRYASGSALPPPPAVVNCTWYEDEFRKLYCELSGGFLGEEPLELSGWLRIQSGDVDVLRRGFKICRTSGRYPEDYSYATPDYLGISGIIDCERLVPTAGRDSLDKQSEILLKSILRSVANQALAVVLANSERITQNPTALSHAFHIGCTDALGNFPATLVGDDEATLSELRARSRNGVKVYYFESSDEDTIARLLHSAGSSVVKLPADRQINPPVSQYLKDFCAAESCEGKVECIAEYDLDSLSRFERIFAYELESIIKNSYYIDSVRVIGGRLSRDVPVYVPELDPNNFVVFLDVRHEEVAKYQELPPSLTKAMVRSFCIEYLTAELKKASLRFYGSGSINMEWLKSRPDQWVLFSEEVLLLHAPDIALLKPGKPAPVFAPGEEPKLLRFVDEEGLSKFAGFYLRMPDGPAGAFKEEILVLDKRSATWCGNKIGLYVSDGYGTVFDFQLRLERIIGSSGRANEIHGSTGIARQIYDIYNGLYFPVPVELEGVLVPRSGDGLKVTVLFEYMTPESL